MSNYDHIAPCYDFLSFMVFGNSQRNASKYFFGEIPLGSKILIVGGGTGKILEDLSLLKHNNFKVVYLEASLAMLNKAKTRSVNFQSIEFLHTQAESYSSPIRFDCIITPFFLDNFTDWQVQRLISHLSDYLNINGIWIHTDFQQVEGRSKWFFIILVQLMYAFFRLIGVINVKSLPDIHSHFEKAGFRVVKSKTFYRGLILTVLYSK